MKLDPILVFTMDWSRNVLIASASGASAEPNVADDIGHLVGIVGIEVVVWPVELELVMLVELIVVVVA